MRSVDLILVGAEDGTARRHKTCFNHVAAAAAVGDHGTNNFATIRTTSIVTKQQKEHMQVRVDGNSGTICACVLVFV